MELLQEVAEGRAKCQVNNIDSGHPIHRANIFVRFARFGLGRFLLVFSGHLFFCMDIASRGICFIILAGTEIRFTSPTECSPLKEDSGNQKP